jgi:hypothetical protein
MSVIVLDADKSIKSFLAVNDTSVQLSLQIPNYKAMNLDLWFATCLFVATFKGQRALCPFPGIPYKATAQVRGQPVNWSNGQSFNFESGDIVTLTCYNQWILTSDQEANITCRQDGTWDRPPPRCCKSKWKEDIVHTRPKCRCSF